MTGVQTCALPISLKKTPANPRRAGVRRPRGKRAELTHGDATVIATSTFQSSTRQTGFATRSNFWLNQVTKPFQSSTRQTGFATLSLAGESKYNGRVSILYEANGLCDRISEARRTCCTAWFQSSTRQTGFATHPGRRALALGVYRAIFARGDFMHKMEGDRGRAKPGFCRVHALRTRFAGVAAVCIWDGPSLSLLLESEVCWLNKWRPRSRLYVDPAVFTSLLGLAPGVL